MKKVLKRYGVIIFIAIFFGITALILFASNDDFQRPFASYNTEYNGTKALYVLVKNFGYNCNRNKEPVKYMNKNGVMISINPYSEKFFSSIEQKNLKKWIEKGNTLIISEYDYLILDLDFIKKADPVEGKGPSELRLGKGKIYKFENYKVFANSDLDSSYAPYELLKIIEDQNPENVIFNEYYHDYGKSRIGIFDVLDYKSRLTIIYFILACLIFLYYKSRSFGFPLRIMELEKRKENENIFALSNILKTSKAHTAVVNIYLDYFRKDVENYLSIDLDLDEEELIQHVKGNDALEKNNTANILKMGIDYVKNEDKSLKKMIYLINNMEKIRKELI